MLKERDRRIEGLEEQVQKHTAAEASQAASSSEPYLPSCANQDIEVDPELEANVDSAIRRSEALLSKLSGLGHMEEPEQQWKSLMFAHEDCRDRLAQIEALVQRRVEQLPPGDVELRVCRTVRGLCVGAQRAPTRRWALGMPTTPSGVGPVIGFGIEA